MEYAKLIFLVEALDPKLLPVRSKVVPPIAGPWAGVTEDISGIAVPGSVHCSVGWVRMY
jgi:hypothetical protein